MDAPGKVFRRWNELGLARHVVPIFWSQSKYKVEGCATGILLRSGAIDYLATAGHVFDDLRRNAVRLCFFRGDGLQEIVGPIFDCELPGRDVDVSLYPIGRSIPADVPKQPIDIDLVFPEELPRLNHEYLLAGFPASKNKYHPVRCQVESRLYLLRTLAASDDQYSKLEKIGFSRPSHLHIVMPLDRRRVVRNGQPRTFPGTKGMSGSPLWGLSRIGSDVGSLQLVGIFTEYHEGPRLLVATDIVAVLQTVKKANQIMLTLPVQRS